MEELHKNDLIYISMATLFAGLSYILVDVALNGVIRVPAIASYIVVLLVTLVSGYFIMPSEK